MWFALLLLLLQLLLVEYSSPCILSRRFLITSVPTSVGAAAFASSAAAATAPSFKEGIWRDIDGDLGITWGGKDRCAPEDASCRDDGQRKEEIALAPVPVVGDYKVTDICTLDVAVAGQEAGTLKLGLFGGAAPTSVRTFLSLCEGDLLIVGRGPWRYEDSQVEQVARGKAVFFGKVKTPPTVTRRDRDDGELLPPLSSDKPAQKHDQAGLLSVPRGGGSFKFLITSGAPDSAGSRRAPWREFDGDDVVIGQVLQGMDVLARLDSMPINKYSGAPQRRVTISAAHVKRGVTSS